MHSVLVGAPDELRASMAGLNRGALVSHCVRLRDDVDRIGEPATTAKDGPPDTFASVMEFVRNGLCLNTSLDQLLLGSVGLRGCVAQLRLWTPNIGATTCSWRGTCPVDSWADLPNSTN